MPNVLDSLVFALLASPSSLARAPEGALPQGSRETLCRADARSLMAALDVLQPHKVEPLLAHQLKAQGLLEALPDAVRERLLSAHGAAQQMNMLLFLSAAAILRATTPLGAPPLLLKGLLLADSYYPEPATRPMSDIDLVAMPGGYETLRRVVTSLGFAPDPEAHDSAHSVTHRDPRGVICDVHLRIQELQEFDLRSLSRPCELRRLRGVEARMLTPEAMLAHLALHMHGHREELGLVLLWLLDIAFVLRRHGEHLDLAQVRALCGHGGAFALLMRTVRFLERYGEPIPEPLHRCARAVLPLTLASVLRQRRLTPWGLPGPRGFARVVAHRLALKHYDRFPQPLAGDLLLWPLDALCTRISPLLVRMTHPVSATPARP